MWYWFRSFAGLYKPFSSFKMWIVRNKRTPTCMGYSSSRNNFKCSKKLLKVKERPIPTQLHPKMQALVKWAIFLGSCPCLSGLQFCCFSSTESLLWQVLCMFIPILLFFPFSRYMGMCKYPSTEREAVLLQFQREVYRVSRLNSTFRDGNTRSRSSILTVQSIIVYRQFA